MGCRNNPLRPPSHCVWACFWQVPPEKHQEGLVVHTVGYPLPRDVYGGSFIYHMSDSRVALG
jgi:flavin-dependent dehydrogenase